MAKRGRRYGCWWCADTGTYMTYHGLKFEAHVCQCVAAKAAQRDARKGRREKAQ